MFRRNLAPVAAGSYSDGSTHPGPMVKSRGHGKTTALSHHGGHPARRYREFLRERGLKLSEEKTLITHIAQGFNFLGQHVRKYGNKLLIRPTRQSVRSA